MNLSAKILTGAGLLSLLGWLITGVYSALPDFLGVYREVRQLADLGVASSTTNSTVLAAGLGLLHYLAPLALLWMMWRTSNGKANGRNKRDAALTPPFSAVAVPWAQSLAVQTGLNNDFGGNGELDYSLTGLIDFTNIGFLMMLVASGVIVAHWLGLFGTEQNSSEQRD